VNPATGEVLANVAACGKDDVDFAVQKARDAFEDGRWSKLAPAARKDVLIRLCKLIKRNAHELAVMESVDSGKPVYDCETVDIPETIHCLKWHAELAWKIGPALAAGNSVVVKPAEETSLTALRIAELAHQAGVPRGVFNVVTGTGPEVGEPLGRHPDVDMISFTGSTETGRRFLHYSADSNLKEIVLEMGGKNPCIVLDDAENLDRVAAHVVNGAFWNMGENCSAASRLIVHESVKDELLKRVLAHSREWNMGDPLDPENRIGSLVSRDHFEKVSSYLKDASKKQILMGGKSADGIFVEPTIIGVDSNEAKLAREEIFGPVLSVITVKSFDEAITIANDTGYGLTASIFTSNVKRALRGARAIRAGTVTVNCFGEGDITTPFGGYKQSGFGGRDNSLHAHDQYTQLKTIWVDLADDSDEAVD
jgi:gamma-glutamyl-gamma-aminobutyraldehyde dehydrogenase